jgi:long-chain acyl-CoA synthetase
LSFQINSKKEVKVIDKYAVWRKNWPSGVPTTATLPYGHIPIADCLKKQVPEKTAMIFYGREVSFKEWDETADRLATALADMGYKKGDSALFYMYNSSQWAIAYIAAARLGLIIFTADPGYKEYELEYEVVDSGAKLIFCFDQNYPVVEAIRERTGIKDVVVTSFWDYLPSEPTLPLHPTMTPPKQTFPNTLEFLDLLQKYAPNPPKVDINMDEEELVLYTGGTTGPPKGCVFTHGNTLKSGCHVYQLEVGHDLTPLDSFLLPTPLTHIAALWYGLFPSCIYGRRMVILARYDPIAFLQAIEKYKVEGAGGATPIFEMLLKDPALKEYDLSSVKYWVAGEWWIWITPELIKRWQDAVGKPIIKAGYRLTEVANVGCPGNRVGYEIPYEDVFIDGVVPPDEGIDVKVVDFDTREELPLGQQGEIVIKSPARCKYYWNKPKETAELLGPEGWLCTGDIGKIGDEDGYIYWYGRKGSLIRTSGFQVTPGEVEMIGKRNPDIFDIAVTGIPDEKKGQVPKAFVQLVPGSKATAADIEEWYKKNIATYKVPKVEIVPEFPRTPKGSIDLGKLLAKK